jgi:hypothetical protein
MIKRENEMTNRDYETGRDEALAIIENMNGGTIKVMSILMARAKQDIKDALEIHGEENGKDIIEAAEGALDAYYTQRSKMIDAANKALETRQIDNDEYNALFGR